MAKKKEEKMVAEPEPEPEPVKPMEKKAAPARIRKSRGGREWFEDADGKILED